MLMPPPRRAGEKRYLGTTAYQYIGMVLIGTTSSNIFIAARQIFTEITKTSVQLHYRKPKRKRVHRQQFWQSHWPRSPPIAHSWSADLLLGLQVRALTRTCRLPMLVEWI
jgi:hypothetical protein